MHVKTNVTKQEWYNKVEAMWSEAIKETDFSDLGLENPVRKTLDRDQFLAKAESLYTRVIDHVWKDLQAKEKEKNEKQQQESDLRAKLKEQPPEDLMRDLIDSRVQAQLNGEARP